MRPVILDKPQARRLWLQAQALDRPMPFGSGPEATPRAVEHLGYVQIDTINVIERCHHHILFTRIPNYRREHLSAAQSQDKSVFEYWTHALAYLPVQHFRFFLPQMQQHRKDPGGWFASVSRADLKRVLRTITEEGPLTIRDIEDEVLVEKDHPWASRKPSKRALQLAFFDGLLVVSARRGMLKTYDLTMRHFGWDKPPRPPTDRQVAEYLLERALRAQGIISLASAGYGQNGKKAAILELIEARVARRKLVPVVIEGAEKVPHWASRETLAGLATGQTADDSRVHILSPFDPLVIQRQRLEVLFGYQHRFEAYLPKEKRVFGYFALPVLVGDRIAAVLDLKANRQAGKLQIQQWTWTEGESAGARAAIEAALDSFEAFQLAPEPQNE